ncbi:MAG TPA: hypothetical protein VFZ65_14790 [Planctomycetota bacterium]|nr:hypothetical protein [Planctomycetota bacterium]
MPDPEVVPLARPLTYCHILAFEHFGGVPAVIVPENLKAAVVRCAFAVDGDGTLNRSYLELARYYGFLVDPTPPRSPEKKGKVEAGVKYVKSSFIAPRDLNNLGIDGAAKAPSQWLREVADVRFHGTTRERPIDIFEREERPALKPLPPVRFKIVVWKQAASASRLARRLREAPLLGVAPPDRAASVAARQGQLARDLRQR